MLYLLWALGGWCGTPWPGWWRGPHPHPDPDPWWWVIKVVSVVGGILGGVLVDRILVGPETGAAVLTATILGSVIGGRFLGEVVSTFGGRAPAVVAQR
ncbi:MAG TPA: hypothetical protein VHU19_14190 [Pyrinomonadaceae bacterium]|nr:hypothetical protein [Pyrinomonadaceae bacterium]